MFTDHLKRKTLPPTETIRNEDAMNRLGILLLLAALLSGCTSEAPIATPTSAPIMPSIAAPTSPPTPETKPTPPPSTATPTLPSPTASRAPTITSIPVEYQDIRCEAGEDAADLPEEIDEVIKRLGFAIQPSELPTGFDLAGVSSSDNEVRQIYQNANDKNIIIAYPIEFSPDITTDTLGWERPEDAVSSLRAGNRTAHLMTGGWSDASIIGGPALNPKDAKWDYDKSLALFFVCRVDGGRDVEMAIQAFPGTMNWIDAGEIMRIAQSLKRISRSP